MDVTFFMHGLNARNKLVSQKQDCLEAKFSAAVDEQVFERGAKHLDDHDVILALTTIPKILRKALTAPELLQDLCLLNDLRAAYFKLLEFDGHLLPCGDIFAEVDLTEAARADHTTHLEAIVDSHFVGVVARGSIVNSCTAAHARTLTHCWCVFIRPIHDQ